MSIESAPESTPKQDHALENVYAPSDLGDVELVPHRGGLWWVLPKGTMQRAHEGYLYFKNGGRGYTMDDLDG